MLPCGHCGEAMPSTEALERHLRSALAYTPYSCALCRLLFHTLWDAEAHFHPRFGRHRNEASPRIVEALDIDTEERIENWLKQSRDDSITPKMEQKGTRGGHKMHRGVQKMQNITGELKAELRPDSGKAFSSTEASEPDLEDLTKLYSKCAGDSEDEEEGTSEGDSTALNASGDDTLINLAQPDTEGMSLAEEQKRAGVGPAMEVLSSPEQQMKEGVKEKKDSETPRSNGTLELSASKGPDETFGELSMEDELPTEVELESGFDPIAMEVVAPDLPKAEAKPAVPAKTVIKEEEKYFPPEPSLDPKSGKRECALCGKVVHVRHNFTNHAIVRHWDGALIRCRTCNRGWKQRTSRELLSHIANQHPNMPGKMTSLSDAYAFLRGLHEEGILELRDRCFPGIRSSLEVVGDEEPLGPIRPRKPTADCRACGKTLTTDHLRLHLASNHLDRAVFECRLCDFKESYWSPQATQRHLKREHGVVKPSAEDYVDNRPKLQTEMTALVRRLFPERQTEVDMAHEARLVHCRLCGVQLTFRPSSVVGKLNMENHVLKQHTDGPLTRCRLCPNFTTRMAQRASSAKKNRVRRHMTRRHPGLKEEEVFWWAKKELRPLIKVLMCKAFGLAARTDNGLPR